MARPLLTSSAVPTIGAHHATEPLRHALDVDVAIVGGGITGVTAALLIASDKRRVALLEADRFGAGTSGANSAQVSTVPDAGYLALLRRCGVDAGREYISRCVAALEFMDWLVGAEKIDCSWARVPAFWFSESSDDLDRLQDEARAADHLGQECGMVRDVPLPWSTAGGLAIPRQALFHPLRYLLGLSRVARARGAQLYEYTPVLAWEETGAEVVLRTPETEVRARELILATHTPLGVNLLHTELMPVQSYILAMSVPRALPEGLFWDTDQPYHYLRPAQLGAQPLVIVGGADHQTGHERNPQSRFVQLVEYVRPRLGTASIGGWWSAQLYEPADGLPYVGRSPLARHVYVATGFAGVGLVQGTMAAMELAALFRGEARDMPSIPWKATRLSLAAAPRLIAAGVDLATHWVGDRIAPSDGRSLEEVPNGEGRILRVDGQRCAIYRDENGRLHMLSAVCAHLGCMVRWNDSARTWDCPCHGARYAPTGEVLQGPALSGLARIASPHADPYAGMPPVTPDADEQRLGTDKG